jgi:hypothetical protein
VFVKTIITFLLAMLSVGQVAAATQPKQGQLSPAGAPASTAQVVKIGFYPVSVYELDMGSNTYYVDMYVWLRWKGNIDPTGSLEFANMVEEWGKQVENLQSEPKVLPDGSKYQIMKVEGRFVQAFDLIDFPLDQQKLSIRVEDSVNTAEVLAYEIDENSSGIGSKLKIPGWSLTGWSSERYVHDYASSFGEESMPSTYSSAEFSLNIERPISYFYWKLLMPLAIVLLAALSALVLSPKSIDARTALPAGALLTAIFLQKSYSDGLPDLGYLILMDKIYLVAYGLIVLTLIRAIYAFQKTCSLAESEHSKIFADDRKVMVVFLITFMVATAALVSLR